jgi:putative transposase
MTSKPVAFLLADLSVTKSHSRPHVSDNNPFWEAQFKTMKYRPDFPPRFGAEEHARAHCRDFFPWYNEEHHHAGIGFFTPHDVHHGHAEAKRAARMQATQAAYHAHPERFPHGMPAASSLPQTVRINKPLSVAGAALAETADQRAPRARRPYPIPPPSDSVSFVFSVVHSVCARQTPKPSAV